MISVPIQEIIFADICITLRLSTDKLFNFFWCSFQNHVPVPSKRQRALWKGIIRRLYLYNKTFDNQRYNVSKKSALTVTNHWCWCVFPLLHHPEKWFDKHGWARKVIAGKNIFFSRLKIITHEFPNIFSPSRQCRFGASVPKKKQSK